MTLCADNVLCGGGALYTAFRPMPERVPVFVSEVEHYKKTKENRPVTVRVPLNDVAKLILEKYKDLPGQQLLPFTSQQQYNRDIKTMFEKAGLDRIVTVINPKTREEEKKRLGDIASSHLARRTFIGNLYKETPDPNIIGKLSGHKEGSRAFARYRDIDDDMLTDLVSKLN